MASNLIARWLCDSQRCSFPVCWVDMNTTPLRLMILWGVGFAVGTLLIGLTSPLFVRSYLPLHADAMRGVWTLPPGTTYRWRSEGYADSRIGPHGMPGKTATKPSRPESESRVALWGDSQAEGVCLDDPDKLFAQIERDSEGMLYVYPFARSGEDAANWVTQMAAVEKEFGIDQHVLLVAELSDLLSATKAPISPPNEGDVEAANRAIAARLPAFVIQAARYLLREEDGATARKLRFGVGPVESPPVDAGRFNVVPEEEFDREAKWQGPLAAIRSATDQPITLLYAPLVPNIVSGVIRWTDPDDADYRAMREQARKIGLQVVDARPTMRQSAEAGRWPHGFHNGQIGVGHLNRFGNQRLAGEVVKRLVSGYESPSENASRSRSDSDTGQAAFGQASED